jgi:hypothetical protein
MPKISANVRLKIKCELPAIGKTYIKGHETKEHQQLGSTLVENIEKISIKFRNKSTEIQ